MRILFNASTLLQGGGIQVAQSFLREASRAADGHEWCLLLSPPVAEAVASLDPSTLGEVHLQRDSPARSAAARRAVLEREAGFDPDCVFTLFGPAYVKFRRPHLVGFADSWVTHPSWEAYRSQPFPRGWLSVTAVSLYKLFWFRHAQAWVTESETARRGLIRRARLDPDRVHVVSNTCAPAYYEQAGECAFPDPAATLRVLCFAAPYPHKRLDLVPRVAAELARRLPDRPVEFVVTLPADHPSWAGIRREAQALGVADRIHNEGVVPVASGPALFRSCQVCFMPTVLEAFSATYPEAMAMGLPIVTSDLDFAREICADAAVYFRAADARAAAGAIAELAGDPGRWSACVARGKAALARLPTPERKYAGYLELIAALGAGAALGADAAPAA